ncbi:MAG: glycosyltransferase [Candidatus Binataceae bacterium]
MNVPSPALVPSSGAATRPAPELSVIVPTFKERDNVPLLVEKLARTLEGIDWEVVFVDDNSPDGTAAAARELGEADGRVRCIRRIGRRGLAGACIEGMLASQARFVAVMDADLQHDETLLVGMLTKLRGDQFDIAVASRFADGGSAAGLSSGSREQASRVSNEMARRLLGVTLSDPMSGFFMIRRDRFEALAPQLSSQGFKILLDIVATARGTLRIAELPFVFAERLHGESKLDTRVALDFAALVLAKLTNDMVSFRFLLFCMVGLTGIAVHMTVLQLSRGHLSFGAAQTAATVAAISWNFVLNNMFTYRDQRLSGVQFITGLIRFQLICAVGALSNVGIAAWIYDHDPNWWIAGLGGALMGAVWNYVVSAAFVWRQR